MVGHGNASANPGNHPFPGNVDSQEDTVRRHWSEVYGLMYRLTGHTHDAEELTQETFLRAFGKMNQFRPGTSMRAWLLRIATNAYLDRQKRPGRKAVSLQLAQIDLPDPSRGDSQALEDREVASVLQAAITELPETQRVVFLLRAASGMSFREIAESIGVSEETARWHMLEARRNLLKRLEGKL